MHILIIGAAGMVGSKLTSCLAQRGELAGTEITRMTLADVVPTPAPTFAGKVDIATIDLAKPGEAEQLVAGRPDVIFHLAAIVSGEAEADLSKGYSINLDGTRYLFDAIQKLNATDGYRPRVIFTSSLAVFGAPFPDKIDDEFFLTPLTSYGTQKAMCELMLADYVRRGFFDGIGIRLPTICIRPGKPNKAASGFFSNILREPLVGKEAVLPVEESIRHWFASPRAAVGFLIHAAEIDLSLLGARRSLTMPGLSVTVGDQLAALRRFGGDESLRLIRREPDAGIAAIVGNWPRDFNTRRALDLGFQADASFDDLVRVYIDDELGGALQSAGVSS